MRQYKQGIFTPLNKEKYTGTQLPVFRSSLELLFQRWADRNDRVLQWGSENIVIPYLSPKDGKVHRYFVDNVLALRTDKGIKKFLVEIKPDRQTRPPEPSSRKSKKNMLFEQISWAVNASKWESARSWCQKNGFEFVIITEKDLK